LHKAELSIDIGKDSKEYSEIITKDIGIDGVKVRLSADKKNVRAVVESEDSKKLLETVGSIVKELRVIDSVWKIVK
jgi:hypothetical protein